MPAIQLMPASNTEAVQQTEAIGAKPQKLQGLQDAFSNYMRQNSPNTAQVAKQQAGIPQVKAATDNGGNVRQQYEQCQTRSAAQAGKVADGSDNNAANADAVKEAVDGAVEDIKEVIKENLGVDDEEIEAAMEVLGLTQVDLLDPQQLVALAMELTGNEDAGMLLFQENFQNVMQEATAITDGLLQELGMSMDELMAQIQAALQSEGMEQPIDTMLPGQQAQTETQPEGAAQSAQTAEGTQALAQEAVQQPEYAPHRQAVQAQPLERPQDAAGRPQDAAPVQEAQPQEAQQARVETQPEQAQQEGQQAGQGQTAQENPAGMPKADNGLQEDARPDFHMNAHQQEPTIQPQALQDIASEAPLPQTNIQDVIDQIVEYTRVSLTEDVKSIEMQLNPASLGKVYLHVSEKQGTVTAQLTAQNENIKEALVQQAAILKDSLSQQGIKVDAVEVSVGAHEFESNLERDAHGQEEQARQQEEQNQRRSRRSINVNDLDSLDGISGLMSEEEALVAQIMRDNGNNVDYTV